MLNILKNCVQYQNMITMNKENNKFLKYWIPFAEKVYPYDMIVESNNYVSFKDERNKRLIRHINGKEINIIGNIFTSKKYYDEVFNILNKIFKRYVKESHIKLLINKLDIKAKHLTMDFFVNLSYCYPNFAKMIKLYFFDMIK